MRSRIWKIPEIFVFERTRSVEKIRNGGERETRRITVHAGWRFWTFGLTLLAIWFFWRGGVELKTLSWTVNALKKFLGF